MAKQIIISINETLLERLQNLLNGSDARRILGYEETFPYEIQATDWRLLFPTYAQIEYLERLKGRKIQAPEVYRIYIGNDIDNVTERPGGAELPSLVLDNEDLFRREILLRIRNIVGSPRNN